MTRIVEVDENGSLTLPPDIINCAEPHTRYVVETHGAQLTLRPEAAETEQKPRRKKRSTSVEEWEKQWQAFSEELSAVWPEGVSATDIISEMRR